jgi:hypothetical protein
VSVSQVLAVRLVAKAVLTVHHKEIKMNTKGVIYYNRGTKCTIRLLVSLYSLRKHYDGSVTVICSGDQEQWFLDTLKKFNADVIYIPYREGVGSLVLKASLWRHSPYDLTMFMDADTIVLNPIDEYFELIEEHDFVTGNFANWKTSGGTISRRIKGWEKAVPEYIQPALDFGPAVNTGINGWKKGATLLEDWERVCELGWKHQCTTRIVDEIACQLCLPHHKCHVAPTKWGESVKYGKHDDETVIIHYHGSKHAGDRPQNHVWKVHYNELVTQVGVDAIKDNIWGDRALRGYRKQIPKGLTLVSAVNRRYLNKFKENFPLWQQTQNLMELPVLIFAHTDCYDEVVEFLKPYLHVEKIVKWSFPNANGNMREEMLSAFVFGTAKHVRTKYWMKLDCDTTPHKQKVNFPEETFKSVITASSWGYTKMKGDPEGEGGKHWLNKLDDWADGLKDFEGTERLFPDKIEGRRHSHRRIASFCEIEKKNWTKHLAAMCGDRLPVPSQDTVTWYAAKRLGRKITTHKFRKYLKP